jgi:hypothetical protein
METKDKAKQLYNKFYEASDGIGISKYKLKVELAKQCAIIACQEVIDCLEDDSLYADGENNIRYISKYWQEVKNELNQL